MADGYIQTQLVEVNQATSEEAKARNQENPAQFTNTFSDVISLSPGDRVSLQSSFISERGSGNQNTIELKGKPLGVKKTFKFLTKVNEVDLITNLITSSVYSLSEKEVDLVDNEANLLINYYKNMNGTGYFACPRRFLKTDPESYINNPQATGRTIAWIQKDEVGVGYISPCPHWDFMMPHDHFIEPFSMNASLNSDGLPTCLGIKLRNDNSKYTLFVAEANSFSGTQTGVIYSGSNEQSNPDAGWTSAPEYKIYYEYNELINLSVPPGFNSADYVATELSRQLQQVKATKNHIFTADSTKSEQDNPGPNVPVTRTIESTTYKTFPCATEYTMEEAQFASTVGTWWRNWGCIAIKRPEIYKTGRNINSVTDQYGQVQSLSGLLGGEVKIDYDPDTEESIILNVIYEKSTCDAFKAFFDATRLYPEIWDSFDSEKTNKVYGGTNGYDSNTITPDNTRFLHMNSMGNDVLCEIEGVGTGEALAQYLAEHTGLGSSCYFDTFTGPLTQFSPERYSKLLLLYHQFKDRDTFYPADEILDGQFSYGCLRPEFIEIEQEDGSMVSRPYIKIKVKKTPGVGDEPDIQLPINASYFKTDIDSSGAEVIEARRKIGFDLHWTAATTCAICLYNGKKTYPNLYGNPAPRKMRVFDYDAGPGADGPAPINGGQPAFTEYDSTNTELVSLFAQRYVGADSPQISFDGEHFKINQLHTAENLGNRSADGGRYGAYGTEPRVDLVYSKADRNSDAADAVYKINPKEDINEFCPALMPYQGQFVYFTFNGSVSTTGGVGLQTADLNNSNYEAYQIYDSKSGIFFNDMGFTQETWEDGLWGIMGFSYEQFNGSENNRGARVDATNIQKLRYPTTNSEIVPTDTKTWNTNDNGVPLFTDNIPAPFLAATYPADMTAVKQSNASEQLQLLPHITQKTISLDLVADNFPRSMLRGYYTIRSDIIGDSLFTGGQSNSTTMPIVGVVTKENPQNDFYFGTGNDVDFTITKPTIMSSVRVSIHDPNGSFANVDKNSSVLFKIQRQMNTTFNIAQEILQNEKGNKKSNL